MITIAIIITIKINNITSTIENKTIPDRRPILPTRSGYIFVTYHWENPGKHLAAIKSRTPAVRNPTPAANRLCCFTDVITSSYAYNNIIIQKCHRHKQDFYIPIHSDSEVMIDIVLPYILDYFSCH